MQMIKKTQESKPREYNYELLRVLSCIGIISIHVASFYSNFFISEYKVNNISYDFFYIPAFMTCVYESLGRFGVGCFLMLSGAFILNSVKTRDYREFYRHRLYKLGIPTILFSVLLVFYQSMFVDGGGLCRY